MDGVLDGFLRSIRALNDDGPGTAGARKREPRRSSVLAVTGGVCGIGAKIGQQGGRVVVTKTSPTGPAAAAGVAEGDIIRQVDFVDVAGETSDDVALRILGPAGMPVTITFDTAGPGGFHSSVTDTPWVRDRVVERQVTVLRAPIYHPSQLRTAFSPSWSIEPHPLEGAVEWVMAAESSTGEDASGAVGENRALHTDAARTAACEPLEATGEAQARRQQPGKPDNGEAKADGGKELEALVYGGYTFHLPPMSLAAAAGHRACAPPPLTPVSASDAPHNKAVAEAQEAAGHEKATANLEQLPAMTDVPVPSLALYATALPAPAAPHTPDEAPVPASPGTPPTEDEAEEEFVETCSISLHLKPQIGRASCRERV